MDMVVSDSPEIIDLCTPEMDNSEVSMTPVVILSESASDNMAVERFPNLQHRLAILPLYPPCDSKNQSHPLLTNIPRM